MYSSEIFLGVVFTTLLVLLLVAGIAITFFISGRERIKQKMTLSEAKLTFERELRQVETEVSEQMMNRFAQELHDNIGQLLTATKIQIESQKLDNPSLSDKFQIIEVRLEQVDEQLRLLSRTLNPDFLSSHSLITNIDSEIERLKSQKRIKLHWTKPEEIVGLDSNEELMLFRIFQEIAQNALRHSKAQNLFVSLVGGKQFQLKIEDDGQGFDKENVLSSGKASGLRNILKRAAMAGFDCLIETSPGKGSLFILKKVSTLT